MDGKVHREIPFCFGGTSEKIIMKYLSGEDILVIHAKIVDEIGGLHGVRDVNLLASIVHKPQTIVGGKDAYQGIFEKSAVYLEALVNYHVFNDGNKRTAIAATAYFLHLNGYALECSDREMVDAVVQVANKQKDIEEIVAWLKGHTKQD